MDDDILLYVCKPVDSSGDDAESSNQNVNQRPKSENTERRKSVKSESRLSSTLSRWLAAHRDKNMPTSKSLNKQWIHPAEALTNSCVTYHVKFLGEVEVYEPKGTNIVREAVRKMKFNYQIKKSEGEKLTKVDLVISVDNVRIEDPKTKAIKHQYPLHRISYCADEKTDSRVFTFIAKQVDTARHFCYGFDSDKCSQDITLTVGQAFDLAYRRYLDNCSKDSESKKQIIVLQKQVETLKQENITLRSRITDLEALKDRELVERYKAANNIVNLQSSETNNNQPIMSNPTQNSAVSAINDEILGSRSVVGRKLEHLVFDDDASQAPKTTQQSHQQNNAIPALTPPPTNGKPRSNSKSASNGIHSPSNSRPIPTGDNVDAFGMKAFTPQMQNLDQTLINMEKEFNEMKDGFSEGLSFGTDDFNLADLDPLHS